MDSPVTPRSFSPIQALARAPILALFILSLMIRSAFLILYSFDGLYGQDSFAYFNQAVGIAENLPRGQLPPLNFFWPNGYPLLAAVFMWLLGQTELAALLPVLLTGSAMAPLAYLLCREFFGEEGHCAGWLAGLIIAVAGQPILSSVTSMADIPGLFWAMLGMWVLVQVWKPPPLPTSSQEFPERLGTRRSLWKLCLAGLFLALATISRWNYAMLSLPFAVYAIYQTRKYRTPVWPLVFPALIGFAILLVQVWISTHRPEGLFHQWLVGWHPRNFFGNSFHTPDGLQTFERPVWFFNLLPAIHPAYIFPLLGVAIPFGVWRLAREKQWGALILLGGWVMLTYGFLAGIPYENFRFGLALYPPLTIFAGVGLMRLKTHLSRLTHHKFIKIGYWILIGGSLLFMLVWAYRMVGAFLQVQTASKHQVLEIAAQLPPDATILTLGPTLIFDHYTSLQAVEFYSRRAEDLPVLLAESSSLYLLLDIPDIEGRWYGMAPYHTYQWMQAHTRLMPLGQFPPYSLYKVQPLSE
ncbi:MAG: hypothetical protein Fur0022_25840 [Anaerolineales bacterium]